MSNLLFPIHPADCVWATCVALSKEQFNAEKLDTKKDFIRSSGITWPKYKTEIVDTLDKILPDIRSIGVNVHCNCSLRDFLNLFVPSNKVILLLAHCQDARLIEFDDALCDIEFVANSIPENHVGFLNLIVCNPLALGQTINYKNDNLRTRMVNTEASISLWLYYYWYFIRYINENQTDYFTAAKKTSEIFDEKILSAS